MYTYIHTYAAPEGTTPEQARFSEMCARDAQIYMGTAARGRLEGLDIIKRKEREGRSEGGRGRKERGKREEMLGKVNGRRMRGKEGY